ncbi:cytochrome P450 [Pseudovibrio sp. SPO723]|uniref:cytochrome P450 n=1 Tax=Nesiotobacter zosterae TaxID=392721 RepID=UPI0029C29C68|nr:cytochrome P450 [Pseudovibrio sp. SPO723]MDX5594303.1 cytochrome P450 [Pseudovibrio sp. SPO723]
MSGATMAPRLSFARADEINWKNLSQIIRFRPNTRPVELLHEPMVLRRIKGRQVALIADAAAAEQILFVRPHDFPKSEVQRKLACVALGEGISGTRGEQSAQQRRAIRPLFSAVLKECLAQVTVEATADAVGRWRRKGTIDLGLEMSDLALQIAWATLFGPGRYEGRDPVVTQTVQEIARASRADFLDNSKIVKRLTRHFIDSGRWKKVADSSPFSQITNPAGHSAMKLSQAELEANASVLIASGHVSTGISLAWIAWLMAALPERQNQLRESLGTWQAPERSPLLAATMNEALRLFPAVPEAMRDAKVPFEIDGVPLERGALLIVSLYALHRSQRYWEAPDSFSPERFLSGPKAPRGAFIPFSGGPYGCLGAAIAQEEISQVISSVMSQVRLKLQDRDEPAPGLETGVCLYPDRPLLVEVAGL